ncbi:Uncharacterized protein FWK35_00014763 [Aphis craccivora]|uniref:Uncharacterized protein n=1 Tax=Aphis craccivora TaxID=307492 RepID=A0A6G0YNX5_APHCR|nr:Uncharacterized protein FWK35_00014763 [Aphis craccivora]
MHILKVGISIYIGSNVSGKSKIGKSANQDYERSGECIDFIMIRNNAPILNFGGSFRWKSEYPWCIIEVKKKQKKKNDEKTAIFTQNQLNCKYLKCSPNTTEIFEIHMIQIFMKSIENAKNCNISRRYLKILPFLITFEFQILTKIRQIPEYLQIIFVFRPLKHKPPLSPTIRNYILG